MKAIVWRLPWLTLGVAVAAVGLAVGSPAGPAYACDGDSQAAAWAPDHTGAAAAPSGVSAAVQARPVEVIGGGAVRVPAGGDSTFGPTVVNRGPAFRGTVELEVPDVAGLPALRVDAANGGGWRRLTEEGTAGARWYAVDGLRFQTGEMSVVFRLGVGSDAYGAQFRISARVRDAAGRLLGWTRFDVRVIDATLRLRTTFPTELRRGDPYREFDVRISNPSTRTYEKTWAGVSLTTLGERPHPRAAGTLSVAAIRVEQLAGGSWHRLKVRPGCDPTFSAAFGQPFDLAAGASRTLHLRIRLVDSPATVPLTAHYWVIAGLTGSAEGGAEVKGELLIRPHRLIVATPAPSTDPGIRPKAPPATPSAGPASSPEPTLATRPAADLSRTGPPVWPLVIGGALLAGGAGALFAVSRRRRS